MTGRADVWEQKVAHEPMMKADDEWEKATAQTGRGKGVRVQVWGGELGNKNWEGGVQRQL